MYEVIMRGTYGNHIMGSHDDFEQALAQYEKLIVNDLPERGRLYDIEPVSGSLSDEQVAMMNEVY